MNDTMYLREKTFGSQIFPALVSRRNKNWKVLSPPTDCTELYKGR